MLSPSAHTDAFARDYLPPADQRPQFLLGGFNYPDYLNAAVELTDRMVECGFGDNTALIGNGRRRTYKELSDWTNRLAHALVDHYGLMPGNRVLIQSANNLAIISLALCDTRQGDYVRDGWNTTGDTFIRDEDGRFHFAARSDDMIVSSGCNMAGPEVEAALLAHTSVKECAVIGTADAERGQIVDAHVVLNEGVAPDPLTVTHVKATIAPYKISALGEVRAGAAEDANRQDSAVPFAGRDEVIAKRTDMTASGRLRP